MNSDKATASRSSVGEALAFVIGIIMVRPHHGLVA